MLQNHEKNTGISYQSVDIWARRRDHNISWTRVEFTIMDFLLGPLKYQKVIKIKVYCNALVFTLVYACQP